MGGIYLAMLTDDTPSPFLPADEAVNSGKEEEKPAPRQEREEERHESRGQDGAD